MLLCCSKFKHREVLCVPYPSNIKKSLRYLPFSPAVRIANYSQNSFSPSLSMLAGSRCIMQALLRKKQSGVLRLLSGRMRYYARFPGAVGTISHLPSSADPTVMTMTMVSIGNHFNSVQLLLPFDSMTLFARAP